MVSLKANMTILLSPATGQDAGNDISMQDARETTSYNIYVYQCD